MSGGKSYPRLSVPRRPVADPPVILLIPESTRKARGGLPNAVAVDSVAEALPGPARGKLQSLRDEILEKSPTGSIDRGGFLPAYQRFQGNMYRRIPAEAWERRAANVEVIIASGLQGLVASRDRVPAYVLSMAEPTAPFGKLNRWWHDRGLSEILAAYLRAVRPKTVVDLLSLEYRVAVEGYADGLSGVDVKTIDFPGMGRGSQPLRGEKVAEILLKGKS